MNPLLFLATSATLATTGSLTWSLLAGGTSLGVLFLIRVAGAALERSPR